MKPVRPKKLNPNHKMVIYLSAIGKNTVQISQEMEMNQQYVQLLRRELAEEIEEVVCEIKQGIVDKRVGLTKRFDEEADRTFDRLVRLRDGADRDSVSLKAVEMLLDRSTVAPVHSRQKPEEETKIIQLPVVQIMNVLKAATEDGMAEEAKEVLEALGENGPQG